MKFLYAATFALLSTVAMARDNITVTGSSTVFPFSSLVAENYSEVSGGAAPVVESIGTGAGIKTFCTGIGEDTPDIVGASREMKKDELEVCTSNNVTPIEFKIGYDGIVFITAIGSPQIELTPADVYKLVAANIVVDGKLVANPYTKLNEINPAFPEWNITMFIPGEKHGTREVFEQKVLEAGCDKDALVAAGVAKDDVKKTCVAVRKDGRVSDIDGDYSETMARVLADPTAIGVISFYYFEENIDKVVVSPIDGVFPSIETITSGEYPVSRPLYLYVKKEHVGTIPGIAEYLTEFVDNGAGTDGYLSEIGLIPLSEDEYTTFKENVNSL